MTRIVRQTTQVALIREHQKGRHFVLLTERRSICSTKLRGNNSFFLWKMKDSDIESCSTQGLPRSVGVAEGVCRQGQAFPRSRSQGPYTAAKPSRKWDAISLWSSRRGKCTKRKCKELMKTKTDDSARKQSQSKSQGNKSESRHLFNKKSNLKRGKYKPLAIAFIKNQQEICY